MIDRNLYRSLMAAIATSAAVCLIILLAAPVLKPLAWALIIGIATNPHYDRLAARFPGRRGKSAGLMLLIVTICFIVPFVAVLLSVANNAQDWFEQASHLVREVTRSGLGTLERIPILSQLLRLADRAGVDLASHAEPLITGASGFLLNAAAATAKSIAEILFVLAVSLFILFFIYRDGETILSVSLDRFFDNNRRLKRIISSIRASVTAVFVGTVYTCIAQGTTAGIGYYVADIPAPILWGMLTAVAAIVPVVGTGIIWVPLTAFVALQGNYLTALLLGLWCLLFVGLADNLIRPLAVGAQSDIPVLAVVLGAIGGASTIGILGLILGPVVFAVMAALWHDLTTEDLGSEA